ncbi:MAG TPA: YiiX/YebB-like N1pC/P60 family cysteine hydrolase [Planctomycetaceae bacterium]|nr:YiiX/YebB-like N1pC/P60 family cysteine hydrolase [Planctomycetaceae bacterium]
MKALFAAFLLALIPGLSHAAEFTSHDQMVKAVAEQAQTGTLLFSQGDCVAVKVFSGSPYTHVAAVVVEHGVPYVYDSSNGYGVRKQPLSEYIEFLAPSELHVLQPVFRFNDKLTEPYAAKLKSEIGRPYAVKHHLSGERCAGLHCAEYVTDALMASDIIRAKNPTRVSPASLLQGIRQADLYRESLTLTLHVPDSRSESSDSWCGQLWIETKVCTKDFCSMLSRKILCR